MNDGSSTLGAAPKPSRRRRPGSMWALEDLGRERLSKRFFFRDFLMSEIAAFNGLTNIPDDPDVALKVGRRLAQDLLEPLADTFGHVAIRSGFRSSALNDYGNRHKLNCAANDHTGHVWDRPDAAGHFGAMASVAIPWFVDRMAEGRFDWRAMAWWIHDHLPYSRLQFFPKLAAFNIQWHEAPARRIDSFIAPRGCLTKPGMPGHEETHAEWYRSFPPLGGVRTPLD